MTTAKNPGRTGRPWRRLHDRIRRQHRPCEICGKPIDYTADWRHPDSFTVDHIEPIALHPERALDPTNLQAAHRKCNRDKGTGNGTPAPTNSRTW